MKSFEKSLELELDSPVLFEKSFRIPFHLADPAGVLFFGNIYGVVHQIYESWAHESKIWSVWYSGDSGKGYPIRHSEADYLKFMRCGDAFQLRIRCIYLSESSFTLLTEFKKEDVVHARVRTVHTAVDISKQLKTTLHPEMKAFFLKNRSLHFS